MSRAFGRGRAAPYTAVACAAVAWGTWPLFVRIGPGARIAAPLQSVLIMAVLTVVSGLLVARDRIPVRARAVHWLGIAWLGVGDAGNVFFFFGAYEKTSVPVAVLTHYLTPIFVAIAAPFVLRERATLRTWAAVAIAFGGLVLLLEPWRAGLAAKDVVGAAFGAASAVFYASNVLVTKRLTHVFSTTELMFFHTLVAVPLLAVAAYVTVPPAAWEAIEPAGVALIALGAVGPGAAAGLLFVWGLGKIPASHVSTLTLLEPLVAVVLGVTVIGDAVGGLAYVGAPLILVGAALVATQASTPRTR